MTFDTFMVDTFTGLPEEPTQEKRSSVVRDNSVEVGKDTFLIDKNNLDREWEKQSVLTFQLAEAEASAQFQYDTAKRRYETVRSDIDLDIRKNPAKYGFSSKPTEPAIVSLVNTNRSVCEAGAAVDRARYDLGMAKKAVASLASKEAALNALTKLVAINYYTAR